MVIDGPSNRVPHGRHSLPLIDEDGLFALEHLTRIGVRDCPLRRDIELSNRDRSPSGRFRLADPLWPFEGNRRECSKKLGDLAIHGSWQVSAHRRFSVRSRTFLGRFVAHFATSYHAISPEETGLFRQRPLAKRRTEDWC
jgi:hypothetical protein